MNKVILHVFLCSLNLIHTFKAAEILTICKNFRHFFDNVTIEVNVKVVFSNFVKV